MMSTRKIFKNCTLLSSILLIMNCALIPQVQAEKLRITNLNLGAAQKGLSTTTNNESCAHYASGFGIYPNGNNYLEGDKDESNNDISNINDFDTYETIVGLRRYIGDTAVKSSTVSNISEMVFTLQEVDKNNDRNPGWDLPLYFKDKLNNYMTSNGISNWQWQDSFAGVDYKSGQYGLTTLTSNAPTQSSELTLNSNPSSAGYDKYNNKALITKIQVGTESFQVINLHLTAKSPKYAYEQVNNLITQLNLPAGTSDNLILIGDFNIYRDGYHKGACPNEVCTNHQYYWQKLEELLVTQNNFVELGSYSGKCWDSNNTNTCTFKATGRDYTRVDHVFLRPRVASFTPTTTISIERPVIDTNCLLTDHYQVSADIEW